MKDIVDLYALRGFGTNTIVVLVFLLISLGFIWTLMSTARKHRNDAILLTNRVKQTWRDREQGVPSKSPHVAY